jgi:hypothetical protein
MGRLTFEAAMQFKPDPPPEPGKPDFSFTEKLLPTLTAAHEGDVDLRPYCTESNQYGIGSCAGNATADSIEILDAIKYAKAHPGAAPMTAQLSRLFVYTMARSLQDEDGDGDNDIDRDKGTYVRLCMDILTRFGICSEVIWPYDESKVYDWPSIKAMRQAAGHRIRGYFRINEDGDARCEAVIAALRAEHPVVFGTRVGAAFGEVKDLTPQNPPSDNIGGHAMIIVGYLEGVGFIVKNSWGAGWGEAGFCIFSREYIAWSKTHDLWVPTFGSGF